MSTFGLWTAALLAILAVFVLARATLAKLEALRVSFRSSPKGMAGIRETIFRPVGRKVSASIPQRWVSPLPSLLDRAGSPGGFGPLEVMGVQACLACAAALLAVTMWLFYEHGTWVLVSPLVAGLLPILWLTGRAGERNREIGRALPFVLDLLTLVVEAGHDFAAGIAKVVEKSSPGPLHDELSLALRELRMGRSRREALTSMVSRTQSVELRRTVSAILQAEKMGAPLGPALRILSEQIRSERFLLAEKRAAQAPVKMLFPLVAFIFPAVFLVLFGPIVFAMVAG